MPVPQRGEVWLIDFGLAGKTRPALVVSAAFSDRDRSLITVVPHTTSLRGSPFEISARVPFLKPGAFLVQGVTTFPTMRALRRIGVLPPQAFDKVFGGLLRWLGAFSTRMTGAIKRVMSYGRRPHRSSGPRFPPARCADGPWCWRDRSAGYR